MAWTAFVFPAPAAAFEARGIATAIDADTLDIEGGPRVRLFGIDAPEVGQRCKRPDGREWRCGIEARNRLADLVDGKEVRCIGDEFDDYQRLLARCSFGSVEVNALLIREGLSWAFVKYSSAYVDLEAIDRANHLRNLEWDCPAGLGISGWAMEGRCRDSAAGMPDQGQHQP